MSTFDHNDWSVSAALDGELSPEQMRSFERERSAHPHLQGELDRMRAVSARVRSVAVPDDAVSYASDRVQQEIAFSLRHRRYRRSLWSQDVRVPLPAFVAAAAVVIAFMGALALRDIAPRSAGSVADLGAAPSGVNLEVRVGSSDTEALLRWLESQNSVEQVTIELPDSVQFVPRGNPVMQRAADTDDDTLEFVPLEAAEE